MNSTSIKMSQSGSLKRKQQPTISSFFGKSPSSTSGAEKKKTVSNGTTASAKAAGGGDGGIKDGGSKRIEAEVENEDEVERGEDEDEDVVLPSRKRVKGDRTPTRKLTAPLNGDEISRSPRSSMPTSSRTEKFRFQSSPVPAAQDETTAEELDAATAKKERRRKEALHEKFVRRLGGPDCLPSLDKKTGMIEADAEGVEDGEEAGEEEDVPPPAPVKGRGGRKVSTKLTPFEKQLVDLKRKHPDTLLLIEVGYKFCIYGADARVAAKELSIVCIPGKMRFDERESFRSLLWSGDVLANYFG